MNNKNLSLSNPTRRSDWHATQNIEGYGLGVSKGFNGEGDGIAIEGWDL